MLSSEKLKPVLAATTFVLLGSYALEGCAALSTGSADGPTCDYFHGHVSLMIGPDARLRPDPDIEHGATLATPDNSVPVDVGNRPGMTNVCVIDKFRKQVRHRWVGFPVDSMPNNMHDSLSDKAKGRIEEDKVRILWLDTTNNPNVRVTVEHLGTAGDSWPQ
jgi:hypothetical protein